MQDLSLVRKILWKGKWKPISIFLPGNSRGQRSSNPGLLHCRQILYHWATRVFPYFFQFKSECGVCPNVGSVESALQTPHLGRVYKFENDKLSSFSLYFPHHPCVPYMSTQVHTHTHTHTHTHREARGLPPTLEAAIWVICRKPAGSIWSTNCSENMVELLGLSEPQLPLDGDVLSSCNSNIVTITLAYHFPHKVW